MKINRTEKKITPKVKTINCFVSESSKLSNKLKSGNKIRKKNRNAGNSVFLKYLCTTTFESFIITIFSF
ncbi:MAG: hypothetical protein B6D61_09125 [Bacteroidetes bacterium 4484_249]|nr:MAG: hypothetical protein B6D61_09125 [Bacteroidetes bacterium 4484_249]